MKLKLTGSFFVLVVLLIAFPLRAQYMPVVFDKEYGGEGGIIKIAQDRNGNIVMASRENSQVRIAWLDRVGSVTASCLLPGFVEVNELIPMADQTVVVAGQGGVQRSRIRSGITLCGRVVLLSSKGEMLRDIYVGGQGSSITQSRLLPNGTFILGGYELRSKGNKQGMLAKVSAQDKELYKYTPADGDICAALEVVGSTGEYVYAVFSAENNDGVASVVRMDEKGKAYYATRLPAEDLHVSAMAVDVSDGSVVLVGSSEFDGGLLYKIRSEGAIVFSKQIVPASPGAILDRVFISRNGNILAGGTGDRGYYSLMRSDGTALLSGTFSGKISGVGMNRVTGESVITSFDAGRGSFIRISSDGRAEFESNLDGNFDKMQIDNAGDVLLASTTEGRICMISAAGIKLFDRYVSDDKRDSYEQALLFPSGEIMFVGGSRLVKMGHGLYISDVKVTKPVNGYATALFTVTLTGYSTTAEGAPVPVTVNYATSEGSATIADNFTPVSGKLSFIPTGSEANRYLLKQDVEVPVKANTLIEGTKEFTLLLSDVQQSYLIKAEGKGKIEDQQAIVKLVETTDGVEGQKEIGYQLGLFKTDGTPLTNATGTNIVVDGVYGKGSADALDFDMGRIPRTVFTDKSHTASFLVKTLDDTRYELPKSVIVNFDKIYALSSSNIAFEGALLSCKGMVVDQPAVLSIASLGDHTRINNNVVSGFFTVSLQRASDGALLTNVTGGDILIKCNTLQESSAQEGKDFVFTNQHNLRIDGNGHFSAANLNGIVLFVPNTESKVLKVGIEQVESPLGAQPITVSPTGQVAAFNILN